MYHFKFKFSSRYEIVNHSFLLSNSLSHPSMFIFFFNSIQNFLLILHIRKQVLIQFHNTIKYYFYAYYTIKEKVVCYRQNLVKLFSFEEQQCHYIMKHIMQRHINFCISFSYSCSFLSPNFGSMMSTLSFLSHLYFMTKMVYKITKMLQNLILHDLNCYSSESYEIF